MDEDRRKHLELIQAIISRMANNSFLLKGWSVTLVAGLFALAAKDTNHRLALVAYLPAIVFWGLDGYYLSQERCFRSLYDHVRRQPAGATDYSMNTTTVRTEYGNWWSAVRSKTLTAFHGIILLTIIVVMVTFAP